MMYYCFVSAPPPTPTPNGEPVSPIVIWSGVAIVAVVLVIIFLKMTFRFGEKIFNSIDRYYHCTRVTLRYEPIVHLARSGPWLEEFKVESCRQMLCDISSVFRDVH
jgi:hypothetical protein